MDSMIRRVFEFCLFSIVVSWPIFPASADDILIADTFYLGTRPRGDKGDLRDVFANTSLHDFWLATPGTNTVRWQAGDGHDFGWQFSGSSLDPNEPPEDVYGSNGTITARGRPVALVAFTPTATPFAVAANLLPLNLPGNWVAVDSRRRVC
jgi:hypothetical protein